MRGSSQGRLRNSETQKLDRDTNNALTQTTPTERQATNHNTKSAYFLCVDHHRVDSETQKLRNSETQQLDRDTNNALTQTMPTERQATNHNTKSAYFLCVDHHRVDSETQKLRNSETQQLDRDTNNALTQTMPRDK